MSNHAEKPSDEISKREAPKSCLTYTRSIDFSSR